MNLRDRRILIFQQRKWALNIGHYLAKRLQEYGCKLAALTIKQNAHEFILSQNEVKYEHIFFGDETKESPLEFLGNDDFSLEEICDDLGVDSIWPFVQSMRNHVKSYKDKYYYGFKQNRSDEEIILYIKSIYKNIKKVFQIFNPEVIIIPNHVAMQHIMFDLYSYKHNVEMISVFDTKIRGVIFFPRGYHLDRGPFRKRFTELQSGVRSSNFKRAKEYIEHFRASFIHPAGLIKATRGRMPILKWIKSEILPYYKCFKYFAKRGWRNKSNLGITIDNLSPRYILRDHYAAKRYRKGAEKFPYYDFEKIDKYAYFPLQFQPEATIDLHSPRYNNQIEVIRQVAMSMPGDYTLVVKEHPAMVGKRPISYWEKIARTPNAKLIDFSIPNERVIKNSSLIISPNGTIIFEAAVLRIPVVQLGDLFITLCLPNVIHHPDLSTLSKAIKKAFSMDCQSVEYDKQLIDYIAAMYDVGFEVDYYGIWERNVKEGLDGLIDRFVLEVSNALK